VPEETKLLRDAAAAGATRVMNGDVMLVGQSAAAFELWTGLKGPIDVIKQQLGTSRNEPELPVASTEQESAAVATE
jgi:shikimate 5-dehydrogenase